MKYIRKIRKTKANKKVVSIRIAEDIANAAVNAAKEVKKHGYRFSIPETIETALNDALLELKDETGIDFLTIEEKINSTFFDVSNGDETLSNSFGDNYTEILENWGFPSANYDLESKEIQSLLDYFLSDNLDQIITGERQSLINQMKQGINAEDMKYFDIDVLEHDIEDTAEKLSELEYKGGTI